MQKEDKMIHYFANIFGKVATINNGGGHTFTYLSSMAPKSLLRNLILMCSLLPSFCYTIGIALGTSFVVP